MVSSICHYRVRKRQRYFSENGADIMFPLPGHCRVLTAHWDIRNSTSKVSNLLRRNHGYRRYNALDGICRSLARNIKQSRSNNKKRAFSVGVQFGKSLSKEERAAVSAHHRLLSSATTSIVFFCCQPPAMNQPQHVSFFSLQF